MAMMPSKSNALFVAALYAAFLVAPGSAEPSRSPPEWAYPLNPGGPPKPPVDDGTAKHIPNSTAAFTLKEMTPFNALDWHPEAHPSAPTIVSVGRRPDVVACAYCHYYNGQGRPENAALAGLPADYIIQQVGEIHDNRRRGAQPAMLAPKSMIKGAQSATPDEIASAAAYYSQLTYRPWIEVVETDVVPKTEVAGISALAPDPAGGTELLGKRIIEVPVAPAQTEIRDDGGSFIAYVPIGSLGRGRLLANASSGDRLACSACHGETFRGIGPAPPLAGRSPSYIFRQLFDIQSGSRHGPAVELMQPQVAALTEDDMLNLAAFLSSLQP